MRPRTLTLPVYVERDGTELELRVRASVTPADPGVIYGPGDRLREPWPAVVDFLGVTLGGEPWMGTLTDDEQERVRVEALDWAEEEVDMERP